MGCSKWRWWRQGGMWGGGACRDSGLNDGAATDRHVLNNQITSTTRCLHNARAAMCHANPTSRDGADMLPAATSRLPSTFFSVGGRLSPMLAWGGPFQGFRSPPADCVNCSVDREVKT
eukprot:1158311-Pelagomonas_calceolata.AAC.7